MLECTLLVVLFDHWQEVLIFFFPPDIEHFKQFPNESASVIQSCELG